MIYLLEDDDNIRNFVLYSLNNTGLAAAGYDRPSAFWKAVAEAVPELVLLDIMLPEEDGLSVLARLRGNERTKDVPVIMLTAKGTEFDKIVGLDSGADDYVAKPFSIMELISRVRALLRRTAPKTQSAAYEKNGLYVCAETHTVKVNGKEVSLTYKEFELLNLLVRSEGKVFTRDQLLEQVWGYGFDGETRTVDVHIRTLRTKLKSCGSLIETVRGVGYKLGQGGGAEA